eukprot:jgi/Tetstr1/434380/TSEL_023481.t1
MGLRHLTKKGDYMFSFDLKDGFYAQGIAEADRDYLTVGIRGTLYRLAGLPMGWSLSPYYFTTFTEVMVRHMWTPEPEPAPAASSPTPSKRYLRPRRWTTERARLQRVLDALGLERHAEKGFWESA